MKKITFIAILLLCICSLTKAKEKVIEQPPFIAWTSTSIQVDKVVLSDTATVLYIKAFYHPKQWIRISGQSFLKDNNGETYTLRSGIGIKPDTEFWMPESGEGEFRLVFPPIPASATSIDFSEGDNVQGAFKIWGIQLKGKALPELLLPQEAIVHKIDILERFHISTQNLGIIRHDRAIIMVVAQMLVHVVAHAGVEDGLYALLDEIIDMAVHQLGRETDGIRRDGCLTGDIQLAAGERGNGHVKAQIRKQRVPEGQKLIHVEPHRQADCAARRVLPAVVDERQQLFLLVGVKIQAALLPAAGNRPVAAVAADEPTAAAEIVDIRLFVFSSSRLPKLPADRAKIIK